MPHRFKAILFDLDGTLIDSAPDLLESTNAVLIEEGCRALTLDEMKTCLGDGLDIMMIKAYRITGNDPDDATHKRLINRFPEIYKNIVPSPSCIFPGILDFLKTERAKGTKLALITNKYETATHRILEQLGLQSFFDLVLGGDTLPMRKPHPLPILHALEQLGVGKHDAVMIGDSTHDAMAARDAGVASIVVRYGYTPQWPADLIPAAYANHVAECRAVLEAI